MARSRRRYDDGYDDRPARRKSGGSCLVTALAVVVGIPLLSCGGCILIGFFGASIRPKPDQNAPPVLAEQASIPKQPQPDRRAPKVVESSENARQARRDLVIEDLVAGWTGT